MTRLRHLQVMNVIFPASVGFFLEMLFLGFKVTVVHKACATSSNERAVDILFKASFTSTAPIASSSVTEGSSRFQEKLTLQHTLITETGW